jgi:hypothetical protein
MSIYNPLTASVAFKAPVTVKQIDGERAYIIYPPSAQIASKEGIGEGTNSQHLRNSHLITLCDLVTQLRDARDE